MAKSVRINEQIWAKEMRLIGEDGQQIGIVSREEALKIAQEKELDLIEINSASNPIICRVANYDKFRFRLAKKEKEQRQKSKKIDMKEVRLGVRTGEHDLDFKRKKAVEFLKAGKKVKIEIFLKGREHTHRDLARVIIENFLKKLAEDFSFQTDQPIMGSPRGFNCVVTPK